MAAPVSALYSLPDLPALRRFSACLAALLRPGHLVALNGNLGAGKTTLTQALGRALGVREAIASPTFVLINEYHSGPFPVIHADLYRLGETGANGLADELLGWVDAGEALVLVEWACYSALLMETATHALTIEWPPEQPDARKVTLQADPAFMSTFATHWNALTSGESPA